VLRLLSFSDSFTLAEMTTPPERRAGFVERRSLVAAGVATAVLLLGWRWWQSVGAVEPPAPMPIVHVSTRVDLGSFQLDSDRIVAADPAYAADERTRLTLAGAARGQWDAWVGKADVKDAGTRAVELGATRHGTSALNWVVLGNVGVAVDSGQAGFYDPKYVDDVSLLPAVATWRQPPIDEDNLWYSYCCEQTAPPNLAGLLPHGVVSSAGLGDGLYQVLVSRVDGVLVGIRLIFVEQGG
jgi:hypothetical protein